MRVERIRQRPVPDQVPALAGYSPLSCRLLASRGLSGPADTLRLAELLPPDDLKDAEAAARLLLDALQAGVPMVIVGDYDVDGAASTALMVRALRDGFGAQVDYFIPSRFTQGYGLSPAVVEAVQAQSPELPRLLITVDNGIASHAGIAAAQALGMRVIVTDHHLPGDQPCSADAVVNPNQPGCAFPSKVACGCTVAFYVLLVLRRLAADWLTEQGREAPNLADYLDLVALATIADVVPLDGNNRILVEQGLRRLRAGAARPGILALLEAAGRDPTRLTSQDLGFVLGPRLNAAGRMDDMTIGVACLLTDSMEDARALAAMLEEFNQARKQVQNRMVDQATGLLVQAEGLLKQQGAEDSAEPARVRVLWHADWHEGIVGLVAGRLKERLQKPVVALCQGDNGLWKGSARSIPGVHIRDLLAWVDAREPGLIRQFGGHAMAAGLSLEEDSLPRLRSRLQDAAAALVPEEAWVAELTVDGSLNGEQFGLQQAEELTRLGPWGQGCPLPLFCNAFRVVQQRWLGGRHLKLVLQPEDDNRTLDAIWFFCPLDPETSLPEVVSLVYELAVNEFRGQKAPQLIIRAEVPAELI
ncbi:single-stranded-DNA-specific exonuclease RecJ [Natronospirillum operosum]|uniref:Single-stranded-DNA-specific exonuclease RecJ n=1 Tax=Natronospirillum operosum TaxID=2759953 RepID=A0A4Z0WFQ2_9GAMM|nr:single-stranded-DNA-specific exonuclease RecJ [Natronospirillum operosum]TGG95860.1 single-stranded-DNA-specific exonuclease RecJ [Natronospirillum operosum]